MKSRGKHVRFYGNRNRIVRIRNEQAIWMIQRVANQLGLTYQEASELLLNDLENRGAFDWEHLESMINKFRTTQS